MAKGKNAFATLMTVAQDQQGYFTTKQAIDAGYADNTHPYHVRTGNWERVRRGIYRLPLLPPPDDGELMVGLLWSRGRDEKPKAAVSHETALSLFELGDFNPAKSHLIVPPGFRRNTPPPRRVVLHRGSLQPGDVTQLRGLTVCRPFRALHDIASSNPNSLDHLRQAAREARKRGLITEREVSAATELASERQLIGELFK